MSKRVKQLLEENDQLIIKLSQKENLIRELFDDIDTYETENKKLKKIIEEYDEIIKANEKPKCPVQLIKLAIRNGNKHYIEIPSHELDGVFYYDHLEPFNLNKERDEHIKSLQEKK